MTSPAPRKTKEQEAALAEGAVPAPPDGEELREERLAADEPIEEVSEAETEIVEPEPEPDEELDGKAAEYLALAQRTQADFENFRKRMAREAAVAVDRGVAKLAKELLPALDHFELALQAAEADGDEAHVEWAKGIRLIQGEFLAALNRVGIQPFAPEGEPFDPAEHEAMAEREAEGYESGTVVEVYQQGYRLNGSVLRPARVIVAP